MVEQGKFDIKKYLERKTLRTTRVSTTSVHTTQQSLHGTSTNPLVSTNYHEQVGLAIGKGVLEFYQLDLYVRTHYLKFPLRRVSQQEGNAYPLTFESHY
jgi:hypothetical protein